MKQISPVKAKCLLNALCMPGSILSTYLILTTTLGCKYFYLIFFSDEGTEEYRQLGQDYLALKLPCYTAFYFQNYLMV